MGETGYTFQMAGGVPVVTAAAEIDATTAGELRAVLLHWQSRGHATVVVDLTGTAFCDSTGLRELVWAHRRAVANGGGLWLAIPAEGALRRIFTITGLGGVIPCFATLEEALSHAPAARPPRRGAAPKAAARAGAGLVPESRVCEQCGTVFAPQREHAPFCSGACRATWNRAHLGDPAVEASALTWSLAAMSEAAARLSAVQAWDQPRSFAAIGEAVWWVTMVDATMVRHHQGIYDSVLATHTRAGRRLVEDTLAGLRFVRNWSSRGAGLDEIIDTGEGTWRITGWTWKPVGEPAPAWLPARAQAWERARHRAYQERLAGHTIGTTFGQAVTFLTRTGAEAAAMIDTSRSAIPG